MILQQTKNKFICIFKKHGAVPWVLHKWKTLKIMLITSFTKSIRCCCCSIIPLSKLFPAMNTYVSYTFIFHSCLFENNWDKCGLTGWCMNIQSFLYFLRIFIRIPVYLWSHTYACIVPTKPLKVDVNYHFFKHHLSDYLLSF